MENDNINLSTLAPAAGSRQKRKRLGFGESSGLGKTCGKGHKGARARSGYTLNPGFEGGQMPLHRRLPKVGFTSRKHITGENVFELVSIENIIKRVEGTVVNRETLRSAGLVRQKNSKIKILGGTAVLSMKLTVEVDALSKSAREAIETAGGSVKLSADVASADAVAANAKK